MSHFMTADVKTAIGPESKGCKNRALYIAKYPDISSDGKDKEVKKRTLDQFCGIEPDAHAIDIRNALPFLLKTSGSRFTTIHAKLESRLIINQAGGVLENAGLSIDSHMGIPFIPGSSLKGIARAAARESNAEASQIGAVFGWSAGNQDLPDKVRRESYAGCLAFLPAYPKSSVRIVVDVLTCHYPEYYRNADKERALDNEDPRPSFFPAVESGTTFVFPLVLLSNKSRIERLLEALNLPADFDPLYQASVWLENGLCEHGIGAKTNAGYGWFVRDFKTEQEEQKKALEIEEKEQQKAKRDAEELVSRVAEEQRLAAMSPKERCREQLLGFGDEQFAGFARSLSEKIEAEQRALLELLSKEKKDRWKIWKKKKPELADAIKKIADSLGEVLP
jgi:CRISPR type III-B/RAMP module RAMP protein Cmr6